MVAFRPLHFLFKESDRNYQVEYVVLFSRVQVGPQLESLIITLTDSKSSFWSKTIKESKNITTKITPLILCFPNKHLFHTAVVVNIYQWNISAVVGFAT